MAVNIGIIRISVTHLFSTLILMLTLVSLSPDLHLHVHVHVQRSKDSILQSFQIETSNSTGQKFDNHYILCEFLRCTSQTSASDENALLRQADIF